MDIIRCGWVTQEQIYIDYHDKEWGIAKYDGASLFELLMLEGMQAGLSWITILKKRDNYRRCFDNFDPQKIALYDDKKVNELLLNPGIVRHRLKIEAIIKNTQAYLRILKEFASFSDYIWQFVGGKPINNNWISIQQIPAQTMASDMMAKDLKKRGFKFVGSKICYAFMQASGMVNDHTTRCFCNKPSS